MIDYGYEDRLLSLIDLRKVIAKRLSPRQKSVLRAHHKMGETFAEIAQREGISGGRVGQIYYSALHRLRRMIETPIERQRQITADLALAAERQEKEQQRLDEETKRHRQVIAAEVERTEQRKERLRSAIYRMPSPSLETKALSLSELIRVAIASHSSNDEEYVIDISEFLPGAELHPYRSIVIHHQWLLFRFDDGSNTAIPPGLYLIPSNVLRTHSHSWESLSVLDNFMI